MTAPLRPADDRLAAPDARSLRMRNVHRAVSEARRGTPIIILGDVPLVALPAETAGPQGLAAFATLAAELPVLLLAPARAAAALRRPVPQDGPAIAVQLPSGLLSPAALRGLADPTADAPVVMAQSLSTAPAPALAGPALRVAKLGRLLPAVMVAQAVPDATAAAERLGLLSVAAENIRAFPDDAAASLVIAAEASVPLMGAREARIVAFRPADGGTEHLAIVIGHPNPAANPAPLVRLHSECFTGDLLGSLRCDCGEQLRGAVARMGAEGGGVLLYLAQEGRGIGLVNKLRAYALQDAGLDTLDANRALGWGADERSFLVAATMLEELGLRRIRLLTNNPDKMSALAACGIEVVGRVSHAFAANGINDQYLATKAARFGHIFD